MREKLIPIFEKIIAWGIVLLVFFLPLFFLPQFSEPFEFPKPILIFLFVSILTIIWAAKMILERKVKILDSPLTKPILIFFLVFVLSTIFSVHRFSSIYGAYPRLDGGLIGLFIFLLTFFLVVNNIKEKKEILRIFTALSLSGLILVLISLFHFFGFFPFGNLLRSPFLTPAGSADSTSIFLVLILPILIFSFFFGQRKILLILSILISFVFIFYILLISQLAAILTLFFIFLLALFFSKFQLSRQLIFKMGILILISLLLLAINNLGFIRSKIPFLKERPIQHDIVLDQNTGWAIAAGGFQNLKILALGSGPSTYIFDFTLFKPLRFNQSPFWDLRFEKSSNQYFHIISTLGILGFLAFLYLLRVVLRMAKEIWPKRDLLLGISSASVLTFFFLSLFVPAFTLISFFFWLFLGLMIVSGRLANLNGIREAELSLATVQAKELPEIKGEILPWLIGIIAIFVLVPLSWQESKILQAEFYFAKARIEQIKERPDETLIWQFSERASQIMPANDFYHRNLADLALNLAILGQQRRDVSEEELEARFSRAELESRIATDLAPHNIFNWEVRQRVYLSAVFKRGEEILIQLVFPNQFLLDPLNPRHHNDFGWFQFNLRNNIEAAKDSLRTAINLKPDFPDPHYNLARIYKEEGKKDLALAEYELTLNLLNQQITSLEPLAAGRPDLERILTQLKQSVEQIRAEKEEVEKAIEEIKPPAEEIKPPAEEVPPPSP